MPQVFWIWVGSIVAFIAMMIGAALAPQALWTRLRKVGRFLVRPLLVLLVIAIVLAFLVYLPLYGYPTRDFDESALPELIRKYYWYWMLLFLVVACAGTWMLISVARSRKRREGAGGAAAGRPGAFEDLDAAWEEILLRLDAANLMLGRQNVFLLLGIGEDRAAAFIEASGMQVYAQAPAVPDAPIHAYATAEGVFLSLSGASAFGMGEARPGLDRLKDLCRKILIEQPDCPLIRGVAVLLPIDWASRTDSIARAALVREDLRTIRQVSTLNLPVFALFTGMEMVPGFPEFVARLVEQVSPNMRDQRVGFAVPPSVAFSGEMVGGGLTWQSLWFHSWTLHLLAGRLFESRGNAALVTLDHEFRRYRKRLRSILESAFSTHREAEPVLFRGCYFVANGADRLDRAFSAGLVRGSRSRIIAEAAGTSWAEEARREDRLYRKRALAVGLIFGLPCLLVWILYIIPSTMVYGLIGLGMVGIVWAAVLFRALRKS
jgi:type VI secretion system protein ImpL